MNTRSIELLRALAHAPRGLRHFTTNVDVPMSEAAAKMRLDAHVLDGFADAPTQDRGTYQITPLGLDELARIDAETRLVAGRTYGNASMTKRYEPSKWESARAGADNHQAVKSLDCFTVKG